MTEWLDDDALRARSSGVCEKPESYNYRTFLPEKRGLYAEETFGPVAWSAGERRLAEDDRTARWGRIELPRPVSWAVAPPRSVVLVVPPAFRRFTSISARERQALAQRRRAHLRALEASGEWPYCDPLDKLLAEEGLEDDGAIERMGDAAVEPPLNVLYRQVVNLANRLRRFEDWDVPEEVYQESFTALRRALERLDVELAAALPADVLAAARGRAPEPSTSPHDG